MSRHRSPGMAALLITTGLVLAGCGGSAQGAAEQPAEVASVETPQDGGPGIIKLVDEAAKRLDLKTTPVTAGPAGLVLPYTSVVYEPDGSSWVFVQTEELTYQRAAITVSTIAGEQVTLSAGPQAGTEVVSQGAAELVGVESGIDGEECGPPTAGRSCAGRWRPACGSATSSWRSAP